MSLIMDLIGPELFELSALEFEHFSILDFVYTLASTNIDQSVPNLATIYILIKSQMSLFDYGINRIRTSKVICP